jgi:hypothetical protein
MMVSRGPSVKLPGWVRRPPELTPQLQLDRTGASADGPDLATLQDPANDVAYKMIGGAYGVLGAEVLGQLVPRVLDEARWGIYIREAGIAWLCRELAAHLDAAALSELPRAMARSVAAHHYVHCAVEIAMTQTHGADAYLDLLAKQSPRHGGLEERLAETRFRSEALSSLDHENRQLVEGPLASLMSRTPEGRDSRSRGNIDVVVEQLNNEYALKMTAADSEFLGPGCEVPCYLVIEPHLPNRLALSIRQALIL